MKTLVLVMLALLLVAAAFSQPDPPRGLQAEQSEPGGEVHLSWLPPQMPGDLYQNDFSDTTLAGWEEGIDGPWSWTVADGQLRLTMEEAVSADHHPRLYYTEQEFDDFILDVEFMYEDNGDYWRSRRPFISFAGESDNGYPAVQVRSGRSTILVYIDEGDYGTYLGRVGYNEFHNWYINRWIRLTIYSNSPEYRFYVNDRHVLSTRHPAPLLGLIGLGAAEWYVAPPSNLYIDNLNIATVDAPAIDHYNIYRNGQIIASTADLEFTDYIAGALNCTYIVTAVGQTGESLPSAPAPVLFFDNLDNQILVETFSDQATPTGWEVIANHPSVTWRFNGSYAFYEDPQTGYDDADLISPPFSLEGLEYAQLKYNELYSYTGNGNGRSYIDLQLGPEGIWTTLAFVSDTFGWATNQVSLTPYTGMDSLRVRFRVAFWMPTQWNIDNVFVESGPPPPFGLHLNAIVDSVGPDGGTIVYDADVFNHSGNTHPFLNYWSTVIGPHGIVHGPLTFFNFSAPGQFDVTVQELTQTIPPFAPPGPYAFYGKVGRYPNRVYVADAFTFEKSGPLQEPMDPRAADMHHWSSDDEALRSVLQGLDSGLAADAAESELPEQFSLTRVFPNPFNPTANFTVSLPDAADLTVRVFNVMGQQVAEVVNARTAAGMHTFTIDGSALSSGIYFIQAQVPGELNAIQKVTLMK